ncbi:MAG: class I SAM-dependent methyltransferase [Armatimonadetes bacterium]|jgi:SAM-dependent methyltransferase|nr:class I SAM-dependent methyltransferase [Armatimonadota bacterium]
MRYEELLRMYESEDHYWWFVGRRRLIRALVEKYAPDARRILDVGCGTGGTLDALVGLGDLTGVDLSEDALGFCRSRGHRNLARGLAEALPFRDGSADVVLGCDLLEHMENDAVGLAELLRVARPGGTIIITVPAYRWLWSEHDEAISHLRRYSASDIRGMVEAIDARLVKLTYAVSLVFPIVVAFRVLSRLRLRPMGKPHTQLMSLPPWANRILIWLHDLETWWVTRAGFPCGTTVLAVLRAPDQPEAAQPGQAAPAAKTGAVV